VEDQFDFMKVCLT